MTTYNLQKKEEGLREEIIRVCRLVYQKGYVAATDGNVSARLNDQYILATPSGFSKGFIEPTELIVVDMDGRQVDDYRHRAQRGLRVTSEILLHLEVYRQRPDVEAVVHAHPPITVALSIAGIPIAKCLLPEVVLSLGQHSDHRVRHALQPRRASRHSTVHRPARRYRAATPRQRHGRQDSLRCLSQAGEGGTLGQRSR